MEYSIIVVSSISIRIIEYIYNSELSMYIIIYR